MGVFTKNNLKDKEKTSETILATVTQSVGLKFSNGYQFSISLENGKLIFRATINDTEAFYLDDVPKDFVDALRRMLA